MCPGSGVHGCEEAHRLRVNRLTPEGLPATYSGGVNNQSLPNGGAGAPPREQRRSLHTFSRCAVILAAPCLSGWGSRNGRSGRIRASPAAALPGSMNGANACGSRLVPQAFALCHGERRGGSRSLTRIEAWGAASGVTDSDSPKTVTLRWREPEGLRYTSRQRSGRLIIQYSRTRARA
jgi:hypothetical protein